MPQMTYNSSQFLSGVIEGTSHTTAALRFSFVSRESPFEAAKTNPGLKNPMFKSFRRSERAPKFQVSYGW